MKKKNQEIREMAKNLNINLYEIAEILKISEWTFIRRLRKDFSEEEKQQIINIIQDLAKKKGN